MKYKSKHRYIWLICLAGVLSAPTIGVARDSKQGKSDWVLSTDRAVQQDGLETRVCTNDPGDIRYCLEFQWRDGYLELWGYGILPNDSDRVFKEWSAPALDINGKYYQPLNIDDVEAPVAVEKMVEYVFSDTNEIYCKEPRRNYLRGRSWVAWRMTTGSPELHRTDKRALYYKIINASRRLLKGRKFGTGYQFTDDVEAERQYSLRGLSELLRVTFAEAVAAEPKYGPDTIGTSPPVIPPPVTPGEFLPDTQWILKKSRARPQPGMEHRICANEMNPLILCLELHWQNDRMEFWSLVVAPNGSGIEFADDKVSEFWVDTRFRGKLCRSKPRGIVNGLIAFDNYWGFAKKDYLLRSEGFVFWREYFGSPAEHKAKDESFYKQLSEGKVLTVLHYLKDGQTMAKVYNLSGFAPLLTELFEEAEAAAPIYARKN